MNQEPKPALNRQQRATGGRFKWEKHNRIRRLKLPCAARLRERVRRARPPAAKDKAQGSRKAEENKAAFVFLLLPPSLHRAR